MGKLKEVPGVFSQGESLQALEENIKDAYKLMIAEEVTEQRPDIQKLKRIFVPL